MAQPVSEALESLVLARSETPIFVIDSARRLLYRNAVAAVLLRADAGLAERDGRLSLGKRSDSTLQRLIDADLESGAGHEMSRGMRVECRPQGRSWIVLCRRLEVRPPAFLVWAIGRTRPRAVPAAALRDLFGLSPREIAVVTELLASGAVAKAAEDLFLARETVRSHLKRIFRKCGVHSRQDLFALLHCLSQFS